MSDRPGSWEERLRARFDGRHVHVVGLGSFGGQIALARFLHGLGARLTISDRKDGSALEPSLAQVRAFAGDDLDRVELALGDSLPPDRAADFDFVAPSPAVPPRSPHLVLAASAGVPLVTEMGLFLECCPAAVSAVTGSAGKSTIVALLGKMHEAAGHRTWVGGNIGHSLLDDLPRIRPEDVVVLELSSFQLERLPEGFPPFRVAVLASIFEHHLDWHGSMEAYVRAKQRIFEGQVEGHDVSIHDAPPVPASATPLRGLIMRRNCALAAAAARARNVPESASSEAMAHFEGLPHRLEEVARLPLADGKSIVLVNASKATCPRTAASALAVVDAPLHVILGGAPFSPDSGEEFDILGWACQGAGSSFAIGALEQLRGTLPDIEETTGMDDAVRRAVARARESGGGTVILAPGFPSYDRYANYEERGDHFRRVAEAIAASWVP